MPAATVTITDVQKDLIDGGYHRARLATTAQFTEFDVVAGGLAWCILHSRYTIDVDFVENAAIRDKIKVAENICRALRDDMKCPYELRPHQIQGLDFAAIRQVIAWLMVRVRATRLENEFYVTYYSQRTFHRMFGVSQGRSRDLLGLAHAHSSTASTGSATAPHRDPRRDAPDSTIQALNPGDLLLFDGGAHLALRQWVNAALRRGGSAETEAHSLPGAAPRRVRIANKTNASTEMSTPGHSWAQYRTSAEHVQAVLLEYGEAASQQATTLDGSNASGGATSKAAAGARQPLNDGGDAAEMREQQQLKEEADREAELIERLLVNMATHTERASLSAAGLGAVLSRAAGDEDTNRAVLKAQNAYAKRHAALQERVAEEASARDAMEAKKEQLQLLTTENAAAKKKSKKLASAHSALEAELQQKRDALSQEDHTLTVEGTEVEAALRTAASESASEAEAAGSSLGNLQPALDALQRQQALQAELEKVNDKARRRQLALKTEMTSMMEQIDALKAKEAAAQSRTAEQLMDEESRMIQTLEGKKETLIAARGDVLREGVEYQRLIDTYPTRLEVQQYEARLGELDEETACKFEETRLTFEQHNSASEVVRIVTNEVDVFRMLETELTRDILPSITSTSKADVAERAEFLDKVKEIRQQLSTSVSSVNGKLAGDRDALAQLRDKYEQLQVMQISHSHLADEIKAALAELATLQTQHAALVEEQEALRDGTDI